MMIADAVLCIVMMLRMTYQQRQCEICNSYFITNNIHDLSFSYTVNMFKHKYFLS